MVTIDMLMIRSKRSRHKMTNTFQFLAALAALYLTLVSEWVTATLEFKHKEGLLRLKTLQTFDQHDV